MAQVKAFSLGGLGAPCCCAGSTQICITACTPSLPVYGALVQLFSGATLVDSCTTGASGCCTFTETGSFTVKVTVSGTLVNTSGRTLSGAPITIHVASTDVVCCGGYAIPTTLTLTDAVGSLSFVFDSTAFSPTWWGGHAVSLLSATAHTLAGNVCVVDPATTGPVRVCYSMVCNAGSTPTFDVLRFWGWVFIQGTLTPIWYQDATGFTPGFNCGVGPPASCGSPHVDVSEFQADPSSTSPFTLSGTPVPDAGNSTVDPIGGSGAGGSVVISA